MKHNLADLVAGMTEANRHDEIDLGAPVGREFPNGYPPFVIAHSWTEALRRVTDGRFGWSVRSAASVATRPFDPARYMGDTCPGCLGDGEGCGVCNETGHVANP